MKPNARAGLLTVAALLMFFAAFFNAVVMVPDLRGDLIELGVRPTVLRPTLSALYVAATAMFVFALMVAQAARQAMRGEAIARLPLAFIAALQTVVGAMAFARNYNPHHLGAMLMGVLVGVAIVLPQSNTRGPV